MHGRPPSPLSGTRNSFACIDLELGVVVVSASWREPVEDEVNSEESRAKNWRERGTVQMIEFDLLDLIVTVRARISWFVSSLLPFVVKAAWCCVACHLLIRES